MPARTKVMHRTTLSEFGDLSTDALIRIAAGDVDAIAMATKLLRKRGFEEPATLAPVYELVDGGRRWTRTGKVGIDRKTCERSAEYQADDGASRLWANYRGVVTERNA